MRLPDTYESLSGAALAAAVGLLRRQPRAVDVREMAPTRIEVVIVPVLKGSVPRGYGDPLEVVGEVTDRDEAAANERALAAVKAAAVDVRVRAGWAAVVARRIGGDR